MKVWVSPNMLAKAKALLPEHEIVEDETLLPDTWIIGSCPIPPITNGNGGIQALMYLIISEGKNVKSVKRRLYPILVMLWV